MLLEIEDLSVRFWTEKGIVRAVDGVHLSVAPGEIVGLVGESGSGKSVTCLAALRLLPSRSTEIRGSIRFAGEELLTAPDSRIRALRGRRIAMIFQDPSGSLNPVHTVGRQLLETLGLHRDLHGTAAEKEAMRLLERVGIPEPRRRMREYPHQLSGGMNQRTMIAIALACRPQLLIADEPTTALDVTIQAQILDLLDDLRREEGMAMILITHDLAVVAQMADRVAVMYAGRIAETAPAQTLFRGPAHPYTRALLRSLPRIDRTVGRLAVIDGSVPPLAGLARGCHFHTRCDECVAACALHRPVLRRMTGAHFAACHLLDQAHGRNAA